MEKRIAHLEGALARAWAHVQGLQAREVDIAATAAYAGLCNGELGRLLSDAEAALDEIAVDHGRLNDQQKA
eukprot:5162890-Prorocentrum_lima.AAC.1